MLQSGSLVEVFEFPVITQQQLQAYAEASGDFNPIHLDEQEAKKVGLPGVIAHGMLSAALIAERAVRFVEKEAPLKRYKLVQFQTRFKAMTGLGDQLSVRGVVKEVTEHGITVELQAKNQKGQLITTGLAQFRS